MRPMTLGWGMGLIAALCAPASGGAQSGSARAMMLPATIAVGLSSALPLEPADRQELLEADGPIERALRLIRHLVDKAAVPL